MTQLLQIQLENCTISLDEEDTEEYGICYEKICDAVREFEISVDKTSKVLLDSDIRIADIKNWIGEQKILLEPFRTARTRAKQCRENELLAQEEKKVEQFARLAEERRQRFVDEEGLVINASRSESASSFASATGSIIKRKSARLQEYTISPFKGDYIDWTRFWNQFKVEVDGSDIAEISKFNYLTEMLKGKPKDDISGLPHTPAGYIEAKNILMENYGKDIKIHRALIKELEGLPEIHSLEHLPEIHEFYEKLARIVRTLRTLEKIDSAQSTVYTLFDKLGPVREILAQRDDCWEDWKLEDLVKHLKLYVDRNPLPMVTEEKPSFPHNEKPNRYNRGGGEVDKLLFQNLNRTFACVYCSSTEHKSFQCVKILSVAGRREILKNKGLCFNCTRDGHNAQKCKSRGCLKCGQKHHTSICLNPVPTTTVSGTEGVTELLKMSNSTTTTTLHAMVRANVGGVQTRVMIDTGAGSSYISTQLITILGIKPVRRETRVIEQMFGTVTRKVEIFEVKVRSNEIEGFEMNLECVNAEKSTLTSLPNPHFKELKGKHQRLKKLKFSDEEVTENLLPIHILIGSADYPRIKTTEPPILGEDPDKDPGAEFTMLGWVLYGRYVANVTCTNKSFLLNSVQDEFDRLCSLDVLGICEPTRENEFHEEFSETIQQNQSGFYEVKLPWKQDHPTLPENKELTVARLHGLRRSLEKRGFLKEYNDIMTEQKRKGILEPVPKDDCEKGKIVHYNPHQLVVREEAESTKKRVVYDLSARRNQKTPSLNDCLKIGPSLQPLMFDVRLRNRMKPYCITGDIEKAFLQIRVHEEDRDAQRVLWYDDLNLGTIQELRFTRVIFGAGPSPYILGATLRKHSGKYKEKYPETVKSLEDDTYVDDIQHGGDLPEELPKFKKEATSIMEEGGFNLHKWHIATKT